MDWTIFHFINQHLAGHPFLTDEMEDFSLVSVPLLAIATCALWFADRPDRRARWKLATASALLSAALALAANQLIAHLWSRERPTAAHPAAHLFFVAPSSDPSFPSDHAGAAFAIAFAVIFVSRRAGIGFLIAAAVIAVDRVFVGLHYPGDIAGGAAVGFAAAWLVNRFARNELLRLVRWVSVISDPLTRPVWRTVDRRRLANHRPGL